MKKQEPMQQYEVGVDELAETLGVAAEQLARWRGSFRKETHTSGRPRGKAARPKGYLTVGEVKDVYGIKPALLAQWRAAGMPTLKKGTMILVSEKTLGEWIEKRKSTF